ncbi:MAG: ribose-phosphate pyrophosphokinase, partial [Candidatus Marinimicrobia bacterium]|nr:ribose-phosphate pyrophosphokinase [Candidatus Neomarinimicrobiota bacterium]
MKKIILSGSSNIPLAKKLAKQMNVGLGNIVIDKFSDGEKYVNVQENVKEKEVIILQSGSIPSDEHIIELFLILDSVNRMKPKKVTVVMPFYPYRRQERESKKGDAVSAQVVARLLQEHKINKLVLIDLHSPTIVKFYRKPVEEIATTSLFANYFQKKKLDIVVAPDEGSIIRSKKFAALLNVPVLVMKKTRTKHDKVSSLRLKTMSGKYA